MAQPVIKWAGGKTKLVPEIRKRLPSGITRMCWIEPFLGGGGAFFGVLPTAPRESLLADSNSDLINMYLQIREWPSQIISHLKELKEAHSKERYYAERDVYNDRRDSSDVERAARFIYLNKTCFNGLYRVNRAGKFNVPLGSYANPTIYTDEAIFRAADGLRSARLVTGEFHVTLQHAKGGDFVYLDPPYDGTFSAYDKGGFGENEHRMLADVCRYLDQRGVKWLLSNSDTEMVRALYKDFAIDEIHSTTSVSADTMSRGKVQELMIRNYMALAGI